MQDQDHSMLKIEIDRVMTQNKNMTQLNVALNRDAMATAEILDQQNADLAAMRKQLAEKTKEITALKKTAKEQELENMRLSQSAGAMIDEGKRDRRIAKLKAQIVKLEDRVAGLIAKNESLTASHTVLAAQKKDAEKESADSWHTIQKLKLKNSRKVVELEQLIRKQTAELGMKFGTDVFQARQDKVTGENTSLKGKLAFLEAENARLKAKNAALMKENDESKAETRDLRNEFEDTLGRPPQTDIAQLIAQTHGDEDQSDGDANLDQWAPEEDSD